jgi:hypothetical protein
MCAKAAGILSKDDQMINSIASDAVLLHGRVLLRVMLIAVWLSTGAPDVARAQTPALQLQQVPQPQQTPAAAHGGEDELARYFQSLGHYIVEDRKVTNELGRMALPFLDWGFVQPGFIAYVDKKSGAVLPLNDPHDVSDEKQVKAVPIAVPSGVRIRTEPARRGGTFEKELFAPKFPWEAECEVHTLLFDDADQRYKLWYRTKDDDVAYAESKDFKTWDRPLRSHRAYEDQKQTNLIGVIADGEGALGDLREAKEAKPGAGGAFFIDPSAPAEERYKCTFMAHVKPTTVEYARQNNMPLSAMTDPPSTVMWGAVSADGIGWRILPRPIMLHDADTFTCARYDPQLKRYIMYTRLYELGRRSVGMSQTTDFSRWPLPTNLLSAGADESPSVDFYAPGFATYPGRAEIRTMMCLVYDRKIDRSQIRLATSRDGHRFAFTPGEAVIGGQSSAADRDAGFLSAQPSLVRTPDGRMVVFYDTSRVPHKFPRHRFGGSTHYAAWWPADRLAGIEASGAGEFTTAAVMLRGNRIVVNMKTERTGGVQVELRDEKFRPVAGRTFADADNLFGDEPAATLTWNGNGDVRELAGRKIYLRFRLRAAKLFSIAAE